MWEKIKEKCKEKIAEIIIGFVLIVILLSSNQIIDSYIKPRIKDQLVEEGYLNNDVKEGRFVSVDKNSFSSNYTLESKTIVCTQKVLH